MIKTVRIVSLSRGLLGEEFVRHEVDLGLKRLTSYGLDVQFSANALKGIDYVSSHPQSRAQDLLDAFTDKNVDMILCAIGGDDTYRLLPYLFENNQLKKVVSNKVFLGFSDSTINHLMLHKVGLNTFYGQSFLADICDVGKDVLPYTKKYFTQLITTGKIDKITPSDVWYETRTDFGVDALGQDAVSHKNEGFILLQGAHKFEGKILGGCIDSIYDVFSNDRYADTVELCSKYKLFPTLDDWKGKILLLETSEEKPNVQLFTKMLTKLKEYGLFDVLSGVIVGKPADNYLFEEYQKVLVQVIGNSKLPILYNVNVGHATPRCIIPFGVNAVVDSDKQEITFEY